MKCVVKLLTVVFVLGFLVGCGGGGSGVGNNPGGGNEPTSPKISFTDIEANFSIPFPAPEDASVAAVEKYKVYNATQEAFDDFNETVLDIKGYTFNATNDLHTNVTNNITYYATHNSTAGTLQVGILGHSNFEDLTDEIFDDEFGTIDGNLTRAVTYVRYHDNISARYANYAVNGRYLKSLSFNCGTNDGKYVCSKIDDKFIYGWAELTDYAYQYVIIVR
ncbi:MAG: hypothetical protein LBQ18_06935 [Campylobacteraceae bacterium]|jgi:hypothetical protein|nr:hypothetical protein [Campylobacteraceae bacterium]